MRYGQGATISMRETVVDNIKILYSTQYKERHKTLKGIMIQNNQPALNKIPVTTGEGILKCIWYN